MTDLIIKGGTVVDPSQNISEKFDVAISGGKVQEVGRSLPASGGAEVIDASGMIVTPGLVDLHTHIAYDIIRLSVNPETTCLSKGATTAVDAGSTGELNFLPFKKYVIEPARTRILAFINIESLGMIEYADLKPAYTDQRWPALLTAVDDLFADLFVNRKNTVHFIESNRDTIVGIKWAHHGITLLERAREVADEAGTRIMAENHYMPEGLRFLKPGDIVTHAYHFATHRVTGRRDGLTEDGETIHEEFFEAVRRGVRLDVGHGKGSFHWAVGRLALREGLPPFSISTDLWTGNSDGPVFDMPTTMSKFLHLGMGLDDVVKASTTNPAAAIGRATEIGTLKPGVGADVCVLRLVEGRFELTDSYGGTELADRRLMPVHVVRGGKKV